MFYTEATTTYFFARRVGHFLFFCFRRTTVTSAFVFLIVACRIVPYNFWIIKNRVTPLASRIVTYCMYAS